MMKMKQTMKQTMNERVIILDEPVLQFAGGHSASDPHDGLVLFGPYGQGTAHHCSSPPYMVVGTPFGLNLWDTWSGMMNRPAAVTDQDSRLWPPYPSFEVTFGSRWHEQPERRFTIDRDALLEASRKRDPHERCFAVVEYFLQHFRQAIKLDMKPSVAICVIPDEVWTNCRPESSIANPSDPRQSRQEKQSRRAGQMDFFVSVDLQQYELAPDFRRQLKARAMAFDLPVQIIRESTLRRSDSVSRGERTLTPLSDRMWNIGTALYYKCGGKPWKLASARKGVCYIGLAFRHAPKDLQTACCAAQMFLDSGDGIVFLGEYGPWYSPENKQFHLSSEAAENLLRGVLGTYNALKSPDNPPLSEIFLHSRSSISDEEYSGYQDACPSGCKLVGIRVRPERFGGRLFRDGKMPVIRGTFWERTDQSGYLFGSGFKPRIATYDGWEIPVPLDITIQHGEADIEMVARDILALTKLNYNACRLGESQPVTVGFSDAVGEILISNPKITDRRPNFKYYI
jgi:hypothetical protein